MRSFGTKAATASRTLTAYRRKSVHQILVSREFGGAAEIALRLASQAQQDSGEVQHIWLPGKGRAWQNAEAMRLHPHRYEVAGAHSKSLFLATVDNVRFALQLRRAKPDLVHIHDPFTYAALRHGLRLAAVRSVVHVQLDYDVKDLRWAFKSPPDAIVTCADFLQDKVRDSLPSEYSESQKVFTVRNAVDVIRFSPGDKAQAKVQLHVPHDQPVLLMLANLAPHKGQETAIRAVAALKNSGVMVRCWLAGIDRSEECSYEAHLRLLCQELKVSQQVEFLGFRSDTVDLLRASDLLLLPSTREGLPLTILEAQATGVLVLAAPTAGIPEVVADGISGFLIEANDFLAYADRIRQLLQNKETIGRLADTARMNCLSNHSWSNYWDHMLNVYESVGSNVRSARL